MTGKFRYMLTRSVGVPTKGLSHTGIRFLFHSLLSVAALFLVLIAGLPVSPAHGNQLEPQQIKKWVDDMKTSRRGPFKRIRWFCKDGSILPPGEYVCRNHGGGVQHGEWNDRTVAIRKQGYRIATLLADLDTRDFTGPDAKLAELRQILLERFLIRYDDGWIFRRARFYRGAIQVEDERAMASRLMLALIEDPSSRDPARYLLLREAARLLPIGTERPAAAKVRDLAIEIAEQDPGFTDLRIKLHSLPDADDPQRVRDYAKAGGLTKLAGSYRKLAEQLDALYAPQTTLSHLSQLAAESDGRLLRRTLLKAIDALQGTQNLQARLDISTDFSRKWRHLFTTTTRLGTLDRLRLLLAGHALEQEVYTIGNRLIQESAGTDRLTRLKWLGNLTKALYATGLLSERQWRQLDLRIDLVTMTPKLSADTYASELRYYSRVPQWAQRALGFHFDLTVTKWSDITPLATYYIPDRLRESPLLIYTRLLDTLMQDANTQVGMQHILFGQQIATGLRALNPGLRRGVLRMPPETAGEFDAGAIYLLPATTAELPPVAGILTRGEGNSLSHVQLLARNLGIPNVVVDDSQLPRLRKYLGKRIVLAVSPHGRVQIAADGTKWDAIFFKQQRTIVIDPDLHKIELKRTTLHTLRELRARDSGRIVGPKAANLGELAHYYSKHVNRGLVIPFGVFREFLDQPIAYGGPPAFDWLRSEYVRLERIRDPEQRKAETHRMLRQLRQWIVTTDPGSSFRSRLRAELVSTFGTADNIGLFVRSDTNVEDLPGFTGAGLNRTVPNVIGFESIVQAIQQVWASPFSERAYAWRQARMARPEHVYPAVLLLETFPSEKSGAMVTADIDTGDRNWVTIAVNEGVGGAVKGQAAEVLLVHRVTGEVRLLAQATAPLLTEPAPSGGMREIPASGRDELLLPGEIEQLRVLANDVDKRFPMPGTEQGLPAPADIEFGFRNGHLSLFQIRPLVENPQARSSLYLTELDRRGRRDNRAMVILGERPLIP